MMKFLISVLFTFLSTGALSQTQYQHWQWAKSFGGSGNDNSVDMKIKNGFLYVTGTFTSPQINWDGTILTNSGGKDIFITKLDTLGNTVWVQSFGGSGDDDVQQLEINSNGAMALRCQSASSNLVIGHALLNSPDNFYITLGTDGNILNSIVLPVGTIYSDIDIDNENAVYVSGSYQTPFSFNGSAIDSSYGLAGAVVFKYMNALPVWYKNVQVRANQRYEMYDYDIDPYGPPPISLVVGYTPPVTGDAAASIQIEYNESDTVLNITGNISRNGAIDALTLVTGYYPPDYLRNFIYGLKISQSGSVSISSNFYNPWYTFLGNYTRGFATGQSGYTFTSSGYFTLGDYRDYSITTEKNNRQVNSLTRGYQYNNPSSVTEPTAWYPFQTDETGNYLLCTAMPELYPETGKRNVVVLDTTLQEIKRTFVPEINRLPLSIRAMTDTHAVFFGSHFTGGILKVNESLPGNEITLLNNGQSEILIGKYISDGVSLPQLNYPYKTSYKTCNAIDSVQLYLTVNDSSSAAPYTYHWNASTNFSDTTILNPKVYFGGDSIINRLIITDANGMKFSKDFVFFGGRPSDMRLVVSNTNICSNDSIVLTLEGTNFHPCQVSGMPYASYMNTGVPTFTSLGQQIKYTAGYTHTINLTHNYDIEYLNPSLYCMIESPITIQVRAAFINTQDVYVCPGADYTFADSVTVQNIMVPFTHNIHFTNIAGCDSNYIINIKVAPLYNKTKTRNICSGRDFYFPNGEILYNITRDTIYACHFSSMYGCDSVVNYDILVRTTTTTLIDAPVCYGTNYALNYGNYTDTIYNITRDTIYTLNLVSAYYCDSIVKVQIRILQPASLLQLASVCTGGSYVFPDGHVINNITNDTLYSSGFSNINGCDSIISTHIRVVSSYYNSQLETVCSGGSYRFPDGQIMSGIISATSYTSRLTASGGCDSIITTHISVTPAPETTVTVNLCSGNSYTFPDGYTIFNITGPLTHTTTFRPAGECYSIVHTVLNVYPAYQSTETFNTCHGSSFTFPDGSTIANITSNATHTSLLQSINGCDSSITTNINVIRIDSTVVKNNLSLTANATPAVYQWIDCIAGITIQSANSQTYTASSIGNYAVEITKDGCIDTSSCYFITAADLLTGGRPVATVFPVPVINKYTLVLQREKSATATIKLLDFTGNVVMQQTARLLVGKNIIQQDISRLAAGRYTLVIINTDGDKPVIKTIIKI